MLAFPEFCAKGECQENGPFFAKSRRMIAASDSYAVEEEVCKEIFIMT
jgi:hypothetical protein